MESVTDLLRRIGQGEREASAALLPVLYEELRQLAEAKLRQERPGHTLQATALVHEAYMRLVGNANASQLWDGEAHFLGAAAEAMRRVLVDHARQKNRVKRGRGYRKQSLEQLEIDPVQLEVPDHLLDLDQALSRLEKVDPTSAELVQLRYFAGLTNLQAAAAMGISARTASRIWSYARAWLFQEIYAGGTSLNRSSKEYRMD